MKESLQLLLDYSLPFVQADRTTEAELWLWFILRGHNWTVEMIALLLRRQGKGGQPIQELDECLHEAILGSYYADEDGIREVLILLIRAGAADVYTRTFFNGSVSYIACCAATEWNANSTRQNNKDLRLKKLWTEALNTYDYNAEDVISTTIHLKEYFDSHNDSISDQKRSDSEESDPEESDPEESDSAESDCSADVVSSPIRSTCKPDGHCEHDSLLCQPEFISSNQYERSLLEGDALIWRTDQVPSDTRFTELS